jgi:hypothetical protein
MHGVLLQAAGPDGNSLLVGTSKGRLFSYSIALAPASRGGAPAPDGPDGPAAQQCSIEESSRREVKCQGSSHSDAIDCLVRLAGDRKPVLGKLPEWSRQCCAELQLPPSCLRAVVALLQRFLPGSRLATKSCDGRMFVWRLSTGGSGSNADSGSCDNGWQLDVATSWKVPNCSGGTSWQNRCQFGCTADGRYIAAVREPSRRMLLAAAWVPIAVFVLAGYRIVSFSPQVPLCRATAKATATCLTQRAATEWRISALSAWLVRTWALQGGSRQGQPLLDSI